MVVVDWIEDYLCHGPGDVQGQRIHLDDEQVAFILRAYALRDDGRRIVRRATYSRAKGRAKSELAAMICCAEALGPVRFDGWDAHGFPVGKPVLSPFVKCVATEVGQADNTYGAVYYMLREGAISDTPGLDVGLTRTYVPGGGKIDPVTSAAASKDGGKETFANFDEPHLYVLPELHNLVATIRRNLAKRKIAEPWSLDTSTAYAPGERSVAEMTHAYAKSVAAGKVRDPGFLFDHREGPDPSTFDYDDDDQLRAAFAVAYGVAAEWMDLDRLVAEARDPENDPEEKKANVVRYFLNRPSVRAASKWITNERWDALTDPASRIEDGRRVCLGADGDRTHASAAVGWASLAGDGIMDVGCHVFSASPLVPHHTLHRGQVDYDDMDGYVVGLFGRWDVAEAAFDDKYLQGSARVFRDRLPDERIAAVNPRSGLMRDALACFDRALSDGRVRHDGDPVLRAHVLAAVAERDPETSEITRVRKAGSVPIRALVAVALAVWRVENAPPAAPFFLPEAW